MQVLTLQVLEIESPYQLERMLCLEETWLIPGDMGSVVTTDRGVKNSKYEHRGCERKSGRVNPCIGVWYWNRDRTDWAWNWCERHIRKSKVNSRDRITVVEHNSSLFCSVKTIQRGSGTIDSHILL